MVALVHSSTHVPLSMLQEVYLLDESSDDCYDIDGGDGGDNDERLIVSTAGSDCIGFGSRLHHQEGFPCVVNNPYDMIILRVKELVSVVAASRNSRESGIAVEEEEALDKRISIEKEKLASKKPAPLGGVVSTCPERKVRKTKVSGWSVTL